MLDEDLISISLLFNFLFRSLLMHCSSLARGSLSCCSRGVSHPSSMLFRYLSNYYCYILYLLLFQVAGRGIILLLQRCRRPAVHDDVESSAGDEDSDYYGESEDPDDDGDLLSHDPVAAPKPPAVVVPGILLFLFLIQVILLSVNFTGKKSRGGVMYNTLARLGTPLTR